MAIEVERMMAVLEARITQFEKSFDRARAKSRDTTRQIERDGERMKARLAQIYGGAGSTFSNLLKNPLTGGLTGLAGGAAFVRYADNYKTMTNQLRVAGLEGEALDKVLLTLAASAKANYAPLDSLVTLYGRAAQAAKELGASQDDLLAFSDNVAKALRVAGSSPEAASGALLQLSQLLGSARVQAEEFNSVNEGARPILQAVADGLVEAGGSVSKLKQLVNDGEVSNRAFFEAFQVGAAGLEDKLSGTATTVAGAMTNLRTDLTLLAGRLDGGTKSSEALVDAIGQLGRAATELVDFFEQIADPAKEAAGYMKEIKDAIDRVATAAGELTGANRIGKAIDQALGRADYTQMSDELKTQGGELERQAANLRREIVEMSKMGANSPASPYVENLRRQLQAVEAQISRINQMTIAPAVDTAAAIVSQSPAAAPAPVTADDVMRALPAPQRAAPISTKDFPVNAAGGASAKKIEGLTKSFGDRLQQLIGAAKAAGHDISVFSGKRSVDRQAELWAAAVKKYGSEAEARKWVAPPGRSMHNSGQAADLKYSSDAARTFAHQNASSFGLTFPLGNEPWHIEPTGARGRSPEDRQREAAASAAERRRKAVAEAVADLDRERAALTQTDEQRRLSQELQQAGVDLNSVEGQSIRAKVAALYEAKSATEALATAAQKVRDQQQEIADGGADFAKTFVGGLRQGKSAADALRGALDNLISRLSDKLIDNLFNMLFTGGSGGGLLGGLLSFGGARASGGPVDAGKAYLVGEKGPEPFVPRTAGTILPNSVLRSSKVPTASVARTTIAPTLRMSIDLRGANGDATIERISRRAAAEAAKQSYEASVRDGQRLSPRTKYRQDVLGQDY